MCTCQVTSDTCQGFLIAVAYSAAIGGLATLVGTGPNIFVKGFADQYVSLFVAESIQSTELVLSNNARLYASGPKAFQISFANFILFALPIGIVMLILCWLWLQILYNRKE